MLSSCCDANVPATRLSMVLSDLYPQRTSLWVQIRKVHLKQLMVWFLDSGVEESCHAWVWSGPDINDRSCNRLALYPGLLTPVFAACSTNVLGWEGLGKRLAICLFEGSVNIIWELMWGEFVQENWSRGSWYPGIVMIGGELLFYLYVDLCWDNMRMGIIASQKHLNFMLE